MAQHINAYQFEREYPGTARGERQTVTEHALYPPDEGYGFNVRQIQVEITDPLVCLSTYRSAPADLRPADSNLIDAPCFLNPTDPRAMNLDEALHLGYAKVFA